MVAATKPARVVSKPTLGKDSTTTQRLHSIGTIAVWLIYNVIKSICLALLFIYSALTSPFSRFAVNSLSEIITSHGYPIESHQVTTKDGYQLTVIRIPHGRNNDDPTESRPVVLLWHGLLDSCYTWISRGPKKSLAFMLADAGYDVWLANNRGTTYGTRHIYLDPSSDDFW
eukprot:Colp12_sorted_trinity150504_noHs@1353